MMDPEYEKRLLRQQNGQVSPYNSVSPILCQIVYFIYTNIYIYICINLVKCI